MTEYFVRADGTAANKAAAVGPASLVSACMNMSVFNGETFTDLDIIYFSDQGSVYTSILIPPSSGSDIDNLISYLNVPGETPGLSLSTGTESLDINTESFLRVLGFDVDSISGDNFNKGIRVRGVCSNVAVGNFDVDMSGAAGATRYIVNIEGASDNITIDNITGRGATGDAFFSFGAGASDLIFSRLTSINNGLADIRVQTAENVTISDLISTLCGDRSIYLQTCTGDIVITDADISDPTAQGINIVTSTLDSILMETISINSPGSGGIDISDSPADTIAIDGLEITESVGHSIVLTTSVCLLTLSNGTITAPVGIGLYVHTVALTDGSTINNYNILDGGAVQPAFVANNVDFLKYNSCLAESGFVAGFKATGGATNIDYDNCSAKEIGSVGFVADGTGSVYTYTDCLAENNLSDGFVANNSVADVTYRNNISKNNGVPESQSDGDGFTAHLTNSDIKYYSNLITGNMSSGFALVGESSGVLYGNTAMDNGVGIAQVRAEVYLDLTGGAGWTLKNNVLQNIGSYPLYKVTAASYVTADYNGYISNISPTGAPFVINDVDKTWAEWVAAVGNETHSYFIYKNGAVYEWYKGDDPGTKIQETTFCPITSAGKLVNHSDNLLIDGGLFIAGVNMEGQFDIWGKAVTAIPNIGADQGAGAPKRGGGGFLMLGGGIFG